MSRYQKRIEELQHNIDTVSARIKDIEDNYVPPSNLKKKMVSVYNDIEIKAKTLGGLMKKLEKVSKKIPKNAECYHTGKYGDDSICISFSYKALETDEQFDERLNQNKYQMIWNIEDNAHLDETELWKLKCLDMVEEHEESEVYEISNSFYSHNELDKWKRLYEMVTNIEA